MRVRGTRIRREGKGLKGEEGERKGKNFGIENGGKLSVTYVWMDE